MGARGLSRSIFFSILIVQLVSQGMAAPENSLLGGLQTRAQKIAAYLGFSQGDAEAALPSRRTSERQPNFFSDREFLTERKYSSSTLGVVDTRFVPELDTRVYYTSTGKPDVSGKVPLVDPDAKGLFIFFHGSGTMKAGGGNFTLKMNRLSQSGYAALGFDFPWHQDGSQNPKLSESKEFMEYLYQFIQTLRPGGMPVYLVGHSFGPEILSEVVTRYPHLVQGAAMISPGGFDKVTAEWYQEQTVKMPFMRDLNEGGGNQKGGEWAGAVTKNFVWNKPTKRPDPTIVNPRLKLHVIYGDREEYIPGPLNEDGSPAASP
ncbi:MAG: alpha/beta hydrolase, partial [Bdellovibrionales bacterium]|nr:alpha/beta hydrolase [Bdellovibrionales bacterium]